jgi:hypothetical protein
MLLSLQKDGKGGLGVVDAGKGDRKIVLVAVPWRRGEPFGRKEAAVGWWYVGVNKVVPVGSGTIGGAENNETCWEASSHNDA